MWALTEGRKRALGLLHEGSICFWLDKGSATQACDTVPVFGDAFGVELLGEYDLFGTMAADFSFQTVGRTLMILCSHPNRFPLGMAFPWDPRGKMRMLVVNELQHPVCASRYLQKAHEAGLPDKELAKVLVAASAWQQSRSDRDKPRLTSCLCRDARNVWAGACLNSESLIETLRV